MIPEWLLIGGFGINTISLLVVLLKLVWGSGTGLQTQFHALDKSFNDDISNIKNEWATKFDNYAANIGNVTMSIGDRFHRLELAAMETRAIAAETYMRRDSYHKATDELKRDVRDAHDDLKTDMQAGFKDLREQIDAVSQSIEANHHRS